MKKPTYPSNKYRIIYDYKDEQFYMFDKDNKCVGEDDNGRELGRDAWAADAEQVDYDYDLGLDEHIPLRSRYEKYKKRS